MQILLTYRLEALKGAFRPVTHFPGTFLKNRELLPKGPYFISFKKHLAEVFLVKKHVIVLY